MKTLKVTWKQSQKILTLLASISTKQHARQIIQRNKGALTLTCGSATHCPHCFHEYEYLCENCLWVYAVEKVLGKLKGSQATCPCIRVLFASPKVIPNPSVNVLRHLIIDVERLGNPKNKPLIDEWFKAHIRWASKKIWGTRRPPEGYRISINR